MEWTKKKYSIIRKNICIKTLTTIVNAIMTRWISIIARYKSKSLGNLKTLDVCKKTETKEIISFNVFKP